MNVYQAAVERAFEEGRSVLPNATDDQAAVIEAWARDVLEDDPEFNRRFTSPPRPDLFTEPAKRLRHLPSECPDEDCRDCIRGCVCCGHKYVETTDGYCAPCASEVLA